jgi:polyisoprenoid-binding protein YceI
MRHDVHSAKYAVGWQVGILCLAAFGLLTTPVGAQAPADVPVFQITPVESKITFHVDASVTIEGTFDQWEASLTFTSTAAESAVLDVKIQAASVNTGSGLKDRTLKGDDFFNVDQDPLITFHSTTIVQTGPETFDVQGTFTIRGVSKPETLHLTLTGKGTGSGTIIGTMAFDRKEFGMNSGIPFIKIADRVEVSVNLKGTRVGGPPVVYKQ